MNLSNNNIIQVSNNGIEYIQFKRLLEYNNLINCYTLRVNDIDFNRNTNDKVKLKESYTKLFKSLQISEDTVVIPHQSHTDNIEIVKNNNTEYYDVDGLLTAQRNTNLMLSYADCTPILLYDPVNKVIGNIHSGWKGTVKEIGKKAVIKMIKEYNSNPSDIIVCFGPCIKQCHFEVKEDVKKIFEDKFKNLISMNNDIIKISTVEEGKYYIDTTLINKLILKQVGILEKNIVDSGICTVCNSKYIHSFRNDRENAGRNIALIGLK
jgi:polyphenol oxidase